MGALETPQHAFFTVLGLGGVAYSSVAVVQLKPFDASLAFVLAVGCWFIFLLENEVKKQRSGESKSTRREKSISAPDKKAGAGDGLSELDLTGYAKAIGVSMRTGTGFAEGSTLSKIMMDSLAKEYLRCMSALKCYQTTFGPLLDDIAEPLEVGALDSAAAPTPRSPMANPPSPDPKRRTSNEAQTGTSLCANVGGLADRVSAASSSTASSSSSHAANIQQPQMCQMSDDEKTISPVKPRLNQERREEPAAAAVPQPQPASSSSFGIFGG